MLNAERLILSACRKAKIAPSKIFQLTVKVNLNPS